MRKKYGKRKNIEKILQELESREDFEEDLEEDDGILSQKEMYEALEHNQKMEEEESEAEEEDDTLSPEEMYEALEHNQKMEEEESEAEEEDDTLSPEEMYEALEHNQKMEEEESEAEEEDDTLSPGEIFGAVDDATAKMDEKSDARKKQKTSKRIKEKKQNFSLNNEFNPYTFAIEILNKYRIWHLDSSDWTLWIWNGHFYEPLNDDKLESLIYGDLPEKFKSTLKSCKKSIQATSEFIRRECEVRPIKSEKSGRSYKTFNKKDMRKIYNRVVLKNGVYDVMAGKMIEFDEKLPYYYEIKAKYISKDSSKLNTPYFDKLLKDATGGDKDSTQMIHYAIGMLLLPNKCKKFIVAGNASNSGKSILFGQFLDSLFDASRISRVDSSKLGGRFALGDCEDKLLISCLDIDENVLSSKAAGVIKRATGEEKISSEAKYKSSKETIVRFKFVFATNFGFTTSRYDAGLVNRILALPFIKETAEENQIADLAEKLQEEKDKIVTKILREMRDVIKEDGSIVIPESDLSKQMKSSWTTVNSLFEEFCEKIVDITGDEEDYISWENLYESYRQYFFLKSKSSNVHYEILPKQAFIKSFMNKAEIGYGGKVEQVRCRKFGDTEYPNAVRRLTGIKVKI
nr:DUF5906 domain-containing protein [uncultured Blautia sp.]